MIERPMLDRRIRPFEDGMGQVRALKAQAPRGPSLGPISRIETHSEDDRDRLLSSYCTSPTPCGMTQSFN